MPEGAGMRFAWPDGKKCEYTAFQLRENCRCAACRHELTGEKLLDPTQIKPDIKILKAEILGQYALGFLFSDGHSTGIYTFEMLRDLCPS